jgi:hypothetical protein
VTIRRNSHLKMNYIFILWFYNLIHLTVWFKTVKSRFCIWFKNCWWYYSNKTESTNRFNIYQECYTWTLYLAPRSSDVFRRNMPLELARLSELPTVIRLTSPRNVEGNSGNNNTFRPPKINQATYRLIRDRFWLYRRWNKTQTTENSNGSTTYPGKNKNCVCN